MAPRTPAKSTPSTCRRNGYKPFISSPLNPNAAARKLLPQLLLHKPGQPISEQLRELPRSEVIYMARLIGKKRSRRGRRAANRTLCARLLRRNVQVAWRDHVMMAQLAQYEAYAIQEAQNQTPDPTVPRSFTKPEASTFRFPDMSMFKPKPGVVAVGLAGVIPVMKAQEYMTSGPATAA